MMLRATLGAVALAASAFVLQAAPANADGYHEHKYRAPRHHHHNVVHKPAPVVVEHHRESICLLDWFRHRHAAPVYHAPVHHYHAPRHVHVHKVLVKKHHHVKPVAYHTPLK